MKFSSTPLITKEDYVHKDFWQHISGEKKNTLAFRLETFKDGGQFHCRVSNDWGEKLSKQCDVHVAPPTKDTEYTGKFMSSFNSL